METSQKKYLEILESVSHSPIYVSTEWLNKDKYQPGKRSPWKQSKFIADHRTVSSNEVLFDIDASYTNCRKYFKNIKIILDELKIKYLSFVSGGKGVHISFWFDIDKLSRETEELMKRAMGYGFGYKQIREYLWNDILDKAGIPERIRGSGNGKIFDKGVVSFDDLSGKHRLIRCCGGRKQLIDKNTKERSCHYKCWLKELPAKQPRITNFESVVFPDKIIPYLLPEDELGMLLDEYIKKAEERRESNLSEIVLKGKYVNLESVQNIINGLKRGGRAAGARIISIACANDNLPKTQAYDLLQEYVGNCSQIGETFNFEEAKAWADWIYRQPKVFWNCSLTEELGVHNRDTCDYCRTVHTKAYEFLESTDLLNKIKYVLDELIVGEDDNKLLIFLLALSKDFPNDKGRPKEERWNIHGDPQTQAILLNCDSSSGKSYIAKQILKLFPDENVSIHSRISKSALNYYVDKDMDGQVVMIEELQSIDDSSNQLRLWISEGYLKLTTVEKVKTPDGEEHQLIEKMTKGLPCFITGTAEDTVEHQLNTRMWMLSLDLSAEQTSKILDYQDRISRQEVVIPEAEIRVIQDSLSNLKQYHFINPFSDRELLNIPRDEIRVRRDYQKFLTLMYCVAYLHQYQRLIVENDKGQQFIVCELQDYLIAREVSEKTLTATFMGLSNAQIDVLKILTRIFGDSDFTDGDAAKEAKIVGSKSRSILKHLNNNSYLINVGMENGKYKYKVNSQKGLKEIAFPDAEILAEKTRNGSLLSEKLGKMVRNQQFYFVQNKSKFWEVKCRSENSRIGYQQISSITGTFGENVGMAEIIYAREIFQNEQNTPISETHTKNKKIISAIPRTPKIIEQELLDFLDKKGKIFISELKENVQGVTDEMLDKLKEQGEIYSPKPNEVKRF